MTTIKISVNQFVEYSRATEAGKNRIIKNQLNPPAILIQRYRLAKGSIKRFFVNVNDISPIQAGIERLLAKTPETKWQHNDRKVSIEVLEKFITLKIPSVLGSIKYEVIKTDKKALNISDVNISMSPEVIIKATIKGKVVYGGVKVHIGKSKPFDHQQCIYGAVLLCEFIKKNIAKEGEIVEPDFCFCIDPFAGRVVSAKKSYASEMTTITTLCEDVKARWRKIAA